MVGYKGFRADLTCRGMQYQIGKTVSVEGDLRMCVNGLHFCKNPLEVFCFYEPSCGFRYAEVSTDGKVLSADFGTKCCANSLKVERELTIDDMLDAAKAWFSEHVEDAATVSNAVTAVLGTGLSDVFVINQAKQYYVAPGGLGIGAGFQNCVVNYNGMAVTLGSTSLALCSACYRSVAIADGMASAAVTNYPCCVAIAKRGQSVASTNGYCSVAVTHEPFSLAILNGSNSTAMSLCGTSKVLVKRSALNSMVMAAGDVEVKAPGCIVMLIKQDFRLHASITAVAGTRLFIPIRFAEHAESAYVEIVCGKDPEIWAADVETQYFDIINSYLEKREKCTIGT